MRSPRRFAPALALSLITLAAGAPNAAADEPAPAPPSSAAAPSASPASPPAPASAPADSALPKPPAPAAPQGVLIIAVTDDAAPAARALARDAYADETLRPRIDDTTARVLTGEIPPANSPPKLIEIADVRKAAQGAASEAVTRRLFASLGADLNAVLVVPVTMRDGKPTARILSVAKATFEPVELSGSIEAQPDGSSRVKWAGVTSLFAAFLPKKAPAPSAVPSMAPPIAAAPSAPFAPGPLAPKKEEPPPSRSIFSSPWTWVGIGVVATAGVVVFALSQSQGDAGTLRLQGRVSP